MLNGPFLAGPDRAAGDVVDEWWMRRMNVLHLDFVLGRPRAITTWRVMLAIFALLVAPCATRTAAAEATNSDQSQSAPAASIAEVPGGPAAEVAKFPADEKSVAGTPNTPEAVNSPVSNSKAAGAVPLRPSTIASGTKPPVAAVLAGMTTETFLDRLMLAESGGRDDARNPRSTATGPYQFIESTFLDVVRRHFAQETIALTDPQILTLRTDRVFARRAAEAFSRDNAAALTAEGVAATFPNLRLAFLLGPSAAIRVLQAPPEAALGPLLGAPVLIANPFMAGLTAADLTARAARDLSLPAPRAVARPRLVFMPRVAALAGVPERALPASPIARNVVAGLGTAPPAARRAPVLIVHCNRDLPSCRRWVALQTRILTARHTAGRRGLASARR